MDSGSVANAIHPDDLPSGVDITENTTGKHSSGAGGSIIKKYGSCSTMNQTKVARSPVRVGKWPTSHDRSIQ